MSAEPSFRRVGAASPTVASVGGRPGMPIFGAPPRAKNQRATLVRLGTYFAAHRSPLAAAVGLIGLYTLLGLAGPYLVGVALDRCVARGDASLLPRIALAMLAAFLAANVFQAISNRLIARVSQRALKSLRRDLFRHVQTLPMEFFERRPSGELMSRLTSDVDAISAAVSQNVAVLLASVLTMAGILVAMFLLDRWLALASVVVVPIMVWFTRFIAVFTRTSFRDLQRYAGALNGVMEEAITGQKVVTAFRRNGSVIDAFRAENERVYRAGVYANNYALLLMPLTTVLGNVFVIALAALGGWLALQGLVSVGVIATFVNYGQNFVQPLRQVSILYNTLQAALAGAERVFEILDTQPERDNTGAVALTGVRGTVEFEHVAFGYQTGQTVINDLSLKAAPGQMIALVGPTGAGKTTIVNLLTRFYEIERGAIRIDGVDIRDVRKADLRRALGLVLQDTYLFGATVADNIRYGNLQASDDDVVEAAKASDADAFIRQLPSGYQTVLSEKGGNLSQGQRQLLAIARTLLADPAILVLDEATSSVDTRTEAKIQRSLMRLMKGRTSFVIAHRLRTIRDADEVIVVDGGRIAERGTHDTLLEKQGIYHRLYMSQFKGQAI